MTKKFDVVIGNPPYQEEAQGGGTRDTPVYHLFMDAAYEVGKKAVLITPARFLFNAGFTPKAWNAKMLADPHLTVAHYVPNSDDLFPGTDHRRRDRRHLPRRGPTSASRAVRSPSSRSSTRSSTRWSRKARPHCRSAITSSRSYRYTDKLYEDHPEARALRPEGNAALVNTNAFEQFSFLYNEGRPTDGPASSCACWVLNGTSASPVGFAASTSPGPKATASYKALLPNRTAWHFGRQLPVGYPLLGPGCRGYSDLHHHRLFRHQGRGRGVPEVREVQVRAGDARHPQGHPAQPGEHLEVRTPTRTSRRPRTSTGQANPGDRPAVVCQVRTRLRGDRLHRGQVKPME